MYKPRFTLLIMFTALILLVTGCKASKTSYAPDRQYKPVSKEALKGLSINCEASKLLLDYEILDGNDDLHPIRVFSDTKWTYFQYSKKKMAKIVSPPFALVATGPLKGYSVNMRFVRGDTVIAEKLANKWILRRGKRHLVIGKVVKPVVKPKKGKTLKTKVKVHVPAKKAKLNEIALPEYLKVRSDPDDPK